MHTDSCFSLSMRALTIGLFCCVFGIGVIHAQEAIAPKIALDFEGNKTFAKQDLLAVANKCLAGTTSQTENEYLDYCLQTVTRFIHGKGYLQARLGKPRQEQNESGARTVVAVEEGPLFRLGEVEIEGSRVLAPSQIREMFELKTGDIADGERIGEWLFERVKKSYGDLGYIQYTAEVQPTFHRKDNAFEGVVDLAVSIDEGQAFTIASIRFEGNENVSRDVLLREMGIKTGEVFSLLVFNNSLSRLNQNGQFQTIDVDRDVDYIVDQRAPKLNLTIHLKKRVATEALAPLPEPVRRVYAIQPD